MNKILLTVTVLGSVGGVADLAMAQGRQGDVSSQCAHRRVMPPDPRDDCARKLRSDAQIGYGAASAGNSGDSQASGAGPGNGNGIGAGNGQGNGIGPGNGQGNGIGPGSGGGQAKGRR
jgi:hypothetical protein